MNETAVVDTGPPLHLVEIGQEIQLAMFRRLYISELVELELEHFGILLDVKSKLGDHLVVERVRQEDLDSQRLALSFFKVHPADISVAALAARLSPEVVLTDDLELRKGLESRGQLVVGSLGVLVRAFKRGRLTKYELHSCLDRLFSGSTLYLSRGFRAHARKMIDSLPDSILLHF